jgi:hypothetical protein
MRGSLTVEQAFAMNIEDRIILAKTVAENLESLNKSGIPAY